MHFIVVRIQDLVYYGTVAVVIKPNAHNGALHCSTVLLVRVYKNLVA